MSQSIKGKGQLQFQSDPVFVLPAQEAVHPQGQGKANIFFAIEIAKQMIEQIHGDIRMCHSGRGKRAGSTTYERTAGFFRPDKEIPLSYFDVS